jgi:signal transduction histidine kinase
MTRSVRPAPPRQAATRATEPFLPVAVLVIGVGIALHLAGIVFFLTSASQAAVPWHRWLGLAPLLAAVVLLRRGDVDWALLAAGAGIGLIGSLTQDFGTGSELYLFALIPPFLVLTFVRWRLRTRLFLVLLPVVAFATIHVRLDIPPTTGLLPPVGLRGLATASVAISALVCLAVTARAVQLADRSRKRAERLAEERSRLIDDMSHELRTPVTIVLTAAQAALASERSGESYRATLKVIERQARGLGGLMARMLEMSRAERAEAAIRADDDLAASVERIVSGFRELAEARSISLVLEAGPVAAATDGAVLHVVLGNLLSNAIRFSPDGGRVQVRLEEDGPAPRITVRDQGPGIAPEDLPYVFDRYWRADKARSLREGHHGLGLAIARRYARLLGATVEAESPPGEGAVFIIHW